MSDLLAETRSERQRPLKRRSVNLFKMVSLLYRFRTDNVYVEFHFYISVKRSFFRN